MDGGEQLGWGGALFFLDSGATEEEEEEQQQQHQEVKKFPTFYATRRVITAFTGAHHMSLT